MKMLRFLLGPLLGVTILLAGMIGILIGIAYLCSLMANQYSIRIVFALILPGPLFALLFALISRQLESQSRLKGVSKYLGHLGWLVLAMLCSLLLYNGLLEPLLERLSPAFMVFGIAAGWMMAPIVIREFHRN